MRIFSAFALSQVATHSGQNLPPASPILTVRPGPLARTDVSPMPSMRSAQNRAAFSGQRLAFISKASEGARRPLSALASSLSSDDDIPQTGESDLGDSWTPGDEQVAPNKQGENRSPERIAKNLAGDHFPKPILTIKIPHPAFVSSSGSLPKSLLLSSFHPVKRGKVSEIKAIGHVIKDAKEGGVDQIDGPEIKMDMRWPNSIHEAPFDIFQKDRQLVIADGFQMVGKEDGGLYRYDSETGEVSQLLKPKEGWFYHKAEFVDIDGDGQKELVTARTTSPWFYRAAESELVIARPPEDSRTGGADGKNQYWQEEVIGTGPDYFFQTCDIDNDGDLEIIAPEYSGRQLSMFKQIKPADSTGETQWKKTTIVDKNQGLGELFDLRVHDINNDGEPEILFTNHVQGYHAGVYVAVKDSHAENNWTVHKIAGGFEVRRKGPWEFAPGVAEVFQPRVGVDEKPHIVVSGDGTGDARILKPASENPDNWHYTQDIFVDEPGSMIGQVLAEDLDRDGHVELAVPIYYGDSKKDRVEIFSYEPRPPAKSGEPPRGNLMDQLIRSGVEKAQPMFKYMMGKDLDVLRLAEDLAELAKKVPNPLAGLNPYQTAIEKMLGIQFDPEMFAGDLIRKLVDPVLLLENVGLGELVPYIKGDSEAVSLTALTAAAMKSAAGAYGNDTLTPKLVGKELMLVMSTLVKAMPDFVREMGVVSRSPWIDSRIATLVAEKNIDQVVVLAAGMDTRAYRMPELKDASVFELDFPALIASKERMIGRANQGQLAVGQPEIVPVAKNLVRVGGDLTQRDWPQSLKEAGFDPEKPTIFLAEGLFYYLDQEQALALSAQIKKLSAPDSHLLFDCLNTAGIEQNLVSQMAGKSQVFKSGFDHPETWFEAVGFDEVKVLQPGDAGADFGVDHEQAEKKGFHRALGGSYDRYAHLQPRDVLPADGKDVKRFFFVEAQTCPEIRSERKANVDS